MTEIELVGVGTDGTTHPVVVTAAEPHRVADLRAALGAHLDRRPAPPLYAGATPLPDALPLADAGLANGTVLGVGQPLRGTGGLGGEEISVVGGLHGGPSLPLRPGAELSVGRGQDADLVIDDREVSRAHATVSVTPDGPVRLADANSRNGIRQRG